MVLRALVLKEIEMRTDALNGLALDWAVTTIKDPDALQFGVDHWLEQRNSKTAIAEYAHHYFQNGACIERLNDLIFPRGNEVGEFYERYYRCTIGNFKGYGPDPTTATLRCIVFSELGNEVDIPKELRLPAS
jgi:hypothetical protein